MADWDYDPYDTGEPDRFGPNGRVGKILVFSMFLGFLVLIGAVVAWFAGEKPLAIMLGVLAAAMLLPFLASGDF